jgi:small subunit ribosomal protein S20
VVVKIPALLCQEIQVAHSLSARKRVRQNAKRKAINRMRIGKVKAAVRDFEAAATAHNVQAAEKQLALVIRKLDQTAATRTIHWRTAARKKSRLMKRLNALKVAKTA